MAKRVVVALGGNVILNKREKGTYEEQVGNVRKTMAGILNEALKRGWEMVITHGNGPQVGNILIQNAMAKSAVPEMPMPVCGAMSQGQLGYFIQQSLQNLLAERGQKKEAVTVITQVVVDLKDPAFKNPSKPVGPFYPKEEADKRVFLARQVFREDSSRGYRRVVPSPEPLDIVEIETVKKLIDGGSIAIVAGGGGIPVVKENKFYKGVDAVIDKDKTGALLADMLEADLFIILTSVKGVFANFGKPDETKIDKMSLGDAKKCLQDGHCAEGSMKPKVEAAIRFIEKNSKRQVLITHPEVLKEAMEEKNGTWVKY